MCELENMGVMFQPFWIHSNILKRKFKMGKIFSQQGKSKRKCVRWGLDKGKKPLILNFDQKRPDKG